MKSYLVIYQFFLLFLIFIQVKSNLNSLSNSKSEPIELEDVCLLRPYPQTAEPYYFFPILRARLKNVGDKFSFPSRCFKKNIVIFKEISKDKITLTLQNFYKKETFCSEVFLFHTTAHNFLQFIAFQGEHDILLKRITQDDKDEIKINGVRLFNFCSGLKNTIKSLFNTLKEFYGGLGLDVNAKNPKFRPSIPRDVEKANLRLLELYNHYTPERRNNTVINIDKNTIKSGDAMFIARMDGIDPFLMIVAGGRVGHTVVCSWYDDELYVLESTDGWYWPRHGIQKNKWDDWVKWAHNADFNVVLVPLKEEYRKKLDVKKANEWFDNEVEGLPYGYHTFLFCWIDTKDKNFPFFTGNYLPELIFSLVAKIYPKFSDSIVTEALNIRVGAKNLTLPQVVAESARQGKTFEELMAEPENKEIEYQDGYSYICSAFVMGYYKHGGMFGDMYVSPQEFTPKDLYTLTIYDKEYKKPQECLDDNPNTPYCQIMGKFVLELDNYSTIDPYEHMNERCPTQGPVFVREDGC